MYLLFDIGGTNARFALSEDGKEISHMVVHATPGSWEDVAPLLEVVRSDLVGSEKIDRIVGGVPGQTDGDGGLRSAPNLPEWQGRNVTGIMEEVFDSHASVYNDAMLAALGEARIGAGQGSRVVAYLGIGTGIGGALVVNGEIVEDRPIFEPGQHIMEVGEMKSFEDLVAGAAVFGEYHELPQEIDDRQFWSERGRSLGVGLFNLCLFWSPDVIVLGGSMYLKSPEVMREAADETYRVLLEKHTLPIPLLKSAEHEDRAGLMGALSVVANIEKGRP